MRQIARTASFPAPIGGLNARDSLADMPATDAVILENWWPKPNSVEIRKGYINWTTGYAAPVQTIFKYAPTSGSYRIFAAAGSAFYDSTSTGAIGAPVVTGLTNAQWQYTNIATPGGSFLWAVNGVDNGKLYNGTVWADVSITGVASSSLSQVNVFGNRLFMVEKNSFKVWYLAVQSIAGAATSFDLATIFGRGGYLMAMGTWSIDAGNGLNDQAVFVSSEGEVAIYQGTDPTTWTKIGVYFIGRPIGRRCFTRLAGDFLLLCEQGVFPLSKALQSVTIDRTVAVTDKIQNDISAAVSSYGTLFGWQMAVYPDQNQLWLNVPTSSTTAIQYVQNTITGAWTKFTNMNAFCWEVAGAHLYFGGATTVYQAWTGQFDVVAQVQADALPAYSNFRSQAQSKYFTMVRLSLTADGNPSVLFGLDLDFLNTPVTGALSLLPAVNVMVWGSMVWGSMVWGGGLQQSSSWQTVGGVGYYASVRLTIQGNGSRVVWNATDYVYQVGGVL